MSERQESPFQSIDDVLQHYGPIRRADEPSYSQRMVTHDKASPYSTPFQRTDEDK